MVLEHINGRMEGKAKQKNKIIFKLIFIVYIKVMYVEDVDMVQEYFDMDKVH